ncbi:MAG: hypothetical protein EOO19_13405 [Chryseobacterium sp.]|nr:MAG: hypothetical protein EOO19_13405 [Chryseobacterium sp.]
MSSSCSSDDSKDENETETETGFIKFKYNEKSYSYESSFISSLNINVSGSEGMDNTYKRVALWLPSNVKVGSHPVVFDLQNLETTYQASFDFNSEFNNASATSGTINITKVSADRIEGTFNFSGTQNDKPFSVTEGSFSVEKF